MPAEPLVISVFSGCGGMCLGFARAGLQPALAADFDATACATNALNSSADVRVLDLSRDVSGPRDFADGEDVFALVGGPPCQGFSSAGRKRGDDPRNALVASYLRLVADLSPRWLLLENVEGMLTSGDGGALPGIVRELSALGYAVRADKVNFAAFGLPQSRKRVIVVANRMGLAFTPPPARAAFDAGKHKSLADLPFGPSAADALAGLGAAVERDASAPYASNSPLTEWDAACRRGNYSGTVTRHHRRAASEIFAALRPGQTMRDLPESMRHRSFRKRANRRVGDGTPSESRGGAPAGVRRLRGDLCAPTVTGSATAEFVHPERDRPLTLREAARLQAFPDSFEFAGSDAEVARQIGNAVPPTAAEVFARRIAEIDGTAGGDGPDANLGGLTGFDLRGSARGATPKLKGVERALTGLLRRSNFDPERE